MCNIQYEEWENIYSTYEMYIYKHYYGIIIFF